MSEKFFLSKRLQDRSRLLCLAASIMLLGVLNCSVNAQTIEALRVENNPTELGESTRFQLTLKEATGTAWCGLRIEFGNGSHRDIRIGEAGTEDLKPTFSALYASPGRYQVTAKGRNLSRGLKSAQACDGQAQLTVTVEDSQTRKLREELERRSRPPELPQPDPLKNELERKRELDNRELELKRREGELELEKQKLDLEFRRRELEERERRLKERESEIGKRSEIRTPPPDEVSTQRKPGGAAPPLKDQTKTGSDSRTSPSNSANPSPGDNQRTSQRPFPAFLERDVIGAFKAYAKFSTDGCLIDAGPNRPQLTGEFDGDGPILIQAISLARCLASSVPANYLIVLKAVDGRPAVTRGAPVNGLVEKVSISSGSIVIEALVFVDGDASCCPSQRERRSYRPSADRLLIAGTERLGRTGGNPQPARPVKPTEALPSIPDKPS